MPSSTCVRVEAVTGIWRWLLGQLSSLRTRIWDLDAQQPPFNSQSGWLSDNGNMEAKPGDCYFSSFPDLGDCQELAGEVFTEVRESHGALQRKFLLREQRMA